MASSVLKPAPPSFAECRAILTSPGMPHEVELALVDNRVLPVYKNIDHNLRAFWLKHSVVHPEWEYIVFEEQRYTYKQTNDAAQDVANVLRELYGVHKGDRVAIAMRNFPEAVILFWACGLLGAVVTLFNPWLTDEQLLYCTEKTSCCVYAVDPERADRFEALGKGHDAHFIVARSYEGKGSWKGMKNWDTVFTGSKANSRNWELEPECKPDDDCAILFTSGTTSMPKAVLSSHRSFISNQFNAFYTSLFCILRAGEKLTMPDPNTPQGVHLILSPLFHVAGSTSGLMISTMSHRKNVFVRKWDLDDVIAVIKKENVDGVTGVPSVAIDLLRKSSELAQKLQSISTGGAPVPDSLPHELMENLPNTFFVQAYGLSETNAIACTIGGVDQLMKPGSCGAPPPICEIIIVDPSSGRIVPPGELGEIWIRGSNLFRCYYGDPDATREAMTDDGWFRSGDGGYLDSDGCLFVMDRYKDIIIRGGENIYSTTVENAFYQHPGIMEAAAVGVPDYRLGELVAAIVVLKPGTRLSEQELINYAKQKLPNHVVPVLVLIWREPLERNAAGKILKRKLKEIVSSEWAKRKTVASKL